MGVALIATFTPGVSAQSDPEAAREAARQRRAEVDQELNTLNATEAELEAALEELAAKIEEQERELAAARRAVEAAEERLAEVRAEVAKTKAAITELKALVVERAVSEFMSPPSFDMTAFLEANDLNQAARLRSLLGVVADNDHQAVEMLEEAEARLVKLEAEAARVAAAAVTRRERITTSLAQLEESRREQAELEEALEVRIAEFKKEADDLAAEEDRLTKIIAKREAERRRLEEERRAAEARAAEERRQQAAAGRSAPAPAPAQAAPASGGRLGWPTAGRVTSEFGPRWGRMHAGIDIGAGTGTPIHAANGGTVYHSGWMGGYGNTVLIDHGGGLHTLYAHQSRIVATEGMTVSRGTLIGYVGNTGNSTGPHLHFETRVNGTARNPRNYL